METKIIGVVSVKGGVGKTTITSNLGAILAEKFDKKVLLVDANFSAPNLGMHLGLVDTEVTIHDVLNGNKRMSSAIHNYSDLFHFIPASLKGKKINAESFKNKLRTLRGKYDYILIDASPSKEIKSTIDAAHALIIAVTPDFPTVSTTLGTINKVEKGKKPILGLVLNRYRNKNYEISPKEIEETLGHDIISLLPEDRKLPKSLAMMKPFTLMHPKRKLSKKYIQLAELITGEKLKRKRFFF
jgi:septum site-determining protein MinD